MIVRFLLHASRVRWKTKEEGLFLFFEVYCKLVPLKFTAIVIILLRSEVEKGREYIILDVEATFSAA